MGREGRGVYDGMLPSRSVSHLDNHCHLVSLGCGVTGVGPARAPLLAVGVAETLDFEHPQTPISIQFTVIEFSIYGSESICDEG